MSFTSDSPSQINQLPVSVEFPRTYEEFIPIITLLYKRISASVNAKEGSLFSLEEQGNFQQFFTTGSPFTFRNVYRKTFDMVNLNGGNIAAGATFTTPHNVSSINAATHIYGTATTSEATPKYVPIPYVTSTGANQIQIYATSTNLVLINGTTTALTQAYIVLEVVKN
jgi:hypothetical protein